MVWDPNTASDVLKSTPVMTLGLTPVMKKHKLYIEGFIKSHSEGLIDLMVGDQVTVSSTSGQWAGVRTSTGVVDWFPLPYLRQIKVIIVNIDNVYAHEYIYYLSFRL